jgi:hypothetical protein
MKSGYLLLVLLLLLPVSLRANDGFGGLTATGLQFQQSDSVRMVSEDLFLSPDKIKVRYVFRNDGPAPVTGEVIFPLPPISLADLAEDMMFSIPREHLSRENVVGFTAAVDGKNIAVRSERIAVLEPPYDEQRRIAARYETPGENVTPLLNELGIPLSLDTTKVAAILEELPQPAKDRLRAKGLADFVPGELPMPLWSIIVRYHWTQTFAVGREVGIEHSYTPSPPGGLFIWPEQALESDGYHRELLDTYCIDAGTQKAMAKLLRPRSGGPAAGTALQLDYVLTTATTWHGPIGTFRLTIDKGKPGNILSLCIDGIRKTGPTTFTVEKKEFTPSRDLRLLIVSGPEG